MQKLGPHKVKGDAATLSIATVIGPDVRAKIFSTSRRCGRICASEYGRGPPDGFAQCFSRGKSLYHLDQHILLSYLLPPTKLVGTVDVLLNHCAFRHLLYISELKRST
jgi:hypothetical protein